MSSHHAWRRVPTRLAMHCAHDLAKSATLLMPSSTSTTTVWISKRSLATGRRINNPLKVLGLPPNASFETVKKTFVKLAIQHHPDTSASSLDDDDSSQKFVAIRTAFEQIRHEHNRRQLKPSRYDGGDADEDGEELEYTEEDFLNWFHDLTGVRLTSDQRREMVNLYWKQHKRNGGRHSHGHSWDLARRLVSFQDVFLRNQGKRNPTMATDESNTDSSFSTGPALRRKRPTRR